MQGLTFRSFRKDNIYFRTIEEREKIKINVNAPIQWNHDKTFLRGFRPGPTQTGLYNQEDG